MVFVIMDSDLYVGIVVHNFLQGQPLPNILPQYSNIMEHIHTYILVIVERPATSKYG